MRVNVVWAVAVGATAASAAMPVLADRTSTVKAEARQSLFMRCKIDHGRSLTVPCQDPLEMRSLSLEADGRRARRSAHSRRSRVRLRFHVKIQRRDKRCRRQARAPA